MNDKLCMSVSEVTEALGVSLPVGYSIVKSKGFPSIRLGKRIIVPRKAFEDWLENQSHNTKTGL